MLNLKKRKVQISIKCEHQKKKIQKWKDFTYYGIGQKKKQSLHK